MIVNPEDVRHKPAKAKKVDFAYEEISNCKKRKKIRTYDHRKRYFTERPN